MWYVPRFTKLLSGTMHFRHVLSGDRQLMLLETSLRKLNLWLNYLKYYILWEEHWFYRFTTLSVTIHCIAGLMNWVVGLVRSSISLTGISLMGFSDINSLLRNYTLPHNSVVIILCLYSLTSGSLESFRKYFPLSFTLSLKNKIIGKGSSLKYFYSISEMQASNLYLYALLIEIYVPLFS